MLGLSGINHTSATASFADILLFAAAGMTIFYQISAFTSLTSVGGFFFYHGGELSIITIKLATTKALSPKSDTLEVSDYLLRHGQRPKKSVRQASLSLEELIQLPVKIASADWVYDAQHKNIIGFFDISHAKNIGKAVVTFNYDRKGVLNNAVVTTGVVSKVDAKSEWYREIKK